MDRTSAIEAEQGVVGSILIDARCMRDVQSLLRPEDFAFESNRVIYEMALKLERKNAPIDPVTVIEAARDAGYDLNRGYILQLMDTTPTAANVVEYANIVRDAFLRRKIAELADTAKEQASGPGAPQDILNSLCHGVDELRQEGMTVDLLSPADQMLRFHDHRIQIDSGRASTFVPTGYIYLDKMLGGGLRNSGLYILAARPGTGKSTLSLNIMDRVAKSGSVLLVSLEMDDEEITSKRLARETGIDGNRLLMQPLSESEYIKVANATDRLMDLDAFYSTKPIVTVAQIENMAYQVKNLSLIIVDYFGLIQSPAGRRWSNRVEEASVISMSMKALARKLKVPILLVAQLNREVERRADPCPMLSDLRETGCLEQDADGIIFLYRPRTELGKDSPIPGEDEIHVRLAKNRHGATGEVTLAFNREISRFLTVGAPTPADPPPEPMDQTFIDLSDGEDNPFSR